MPGLANINFFGIGEFCKAAKARIFFKRREEMLLENTTCLSPRTFITLVKCHCLIDYAD